LTSTHISLPPSFAARVRRWGNNELQCYSASPANAAIVPNPDVPGDGVLRIRSIYSATPQACANRVKPASTKQWTSARLITRGVKTFSPLVDAASGACTAISMEARMRAPGKTGMWSAFWALGVSGSW
jgi:hypothetical protein